MDIFGWALALALLGPSSAPAAPLEQAPQLRVVREDSFGVAILSRLPLVEAELVELEGLPMARAVLEVEGRELEVWSVHTLPPRTWDYAGVWSEQMEQLPRVASCRERPLLLMGDFNATPRSRKLRGIPAESAHEACGMGSATTWPNGVFSLPELRLDHALMSEELGCVALEHGLGAGSDHRPVVLELAWR